MLAYFVWLNRGKESVTLDLARADDKALLAAMLARADVFVQNLKPGAIAKLGFPLESCGRAHPRLVICSISGYGEDGPYAARKAYDMLIQAETGLASITGGPEAPARVGVSVCDIAAGMNAYEAILEALIARARTGEGAAISISMFDAMADWMATPLIQYEGGMPPKRIGLAHTSIAPYGVFKTRDGADILISIQSDREWRVLAEKVLGDKALAADPDFATNIERVKRRAETDGRVQAVFGAIDEAALTQKLAAADIAFARVNDTALLAAHPHLRRIEVATPSGRCRYPRPPRAATASRAATGAVPALGEHSAAIRAEFMGRAPANLGSSEHRTPCPGRVERQRNETLGPSVKSAKRSIEAIALARRVAPGSGSSLATLARPGHERGANFCATFWTAWRADAAA